MENTIGSTFVPLSDLSKSSSHLRGLVATVQSGEPICLLDLVTYQDGAIVSRTLSNQKNGSITLFSFDEGQKLSEHTSPFDAFVQILEGNAEITISGKRFSAGRGELVVLPANQPHALNAPTRFKMLLTMIRSMT